MIKERPKMNSLKHIAFICDDNYVMPTIVTLQSLVNSIPKNELNAYIFHICSCSLLSQNVAALESLRKAQINVDIKIVDSQMLYNKFKGINQKTHVSPAALIKFELANIFSDLDKILYLDSDLIIKGDISGLFSIDISNYLLAAVQEFWKVQQDYYDYKDQDSSLPFYFNSGVMMLNLKRFRELDIPTQLWDTKFSQFNNVADSKHMLMDQDTFNEVCANKCYHLPIKYNCDTKFTNEANIELINKTFQTNYLSHLDLKSDVLILHYIGKFEKPWKYDKVVCQSEWDSVYAQTIYADKVLNRIYIKHGFSYFLPKVFASIKDRGLLKTMHYIIDKRNILKR